MNKTERTLIKLPDTEVVKPINEKVCKKIYIKLMKRLALDSINDYFILTYINYKLEKVFKITMNEELHYVGDVIFEKGTLKLPDFFFTVEITKTEDVVNLMTDYPALKDLLTTYAIYLVGVNTNDSREDKIIKNIIATYFATENSCKELSDINTAQMTFSGYAPSSAMQENIIRELALIFGNDLLYETLKYGVDELIKQIDIKTKKKGLGKKIVTSLVELHDLSIIEKHRYVNCQFIQSIINDKLLPMYEAIQNYDVAYQDAILNIIQMKNFDFSILSLIDNQINTSSIKPLTEGEKLVVKEFLHHFDENYKAYRYLETNYPKVKCTIDDEGDEVYDGSTFTFLNKFLSSTDIYLEEYLHICDSIRNLWKTINETIIWELIPRYLKHNENTNIDLESILKLSKYHTNTEKYDLSQKAKTRNLTKKINQSQTRK